MQTAPQLELELLRRVQTRTGRRIRDLAVELLPELDAATSRSVGKDNLAEVRLTCFRTKTGELRADDFDREIPTGELVRKSFQLIGCRNIRSRHDLFLARWLQ